MSSVKSIYEQTIRPLPPMEQLRLASLILDHLAGRDGVEFSETWSDQDLADLKVHSLAHTGLGTEDTDA